MICLNYSSGTGYCEYAGRSTDNKPTEGLETGSKFTEVDTGDEYLFNSVSGEWVKQPQSGGGGGSGGKMQTKTVTPTTSNQTVSPDAGYDGLSSVVVEAITPTKSAETYTPTTSDQTISSGVWLSGDQTIKGDANLLADNIRKDIDIFGVVGTFENEQPGVSVERKDVNFTDYDGTVVYSYTAQEFSALDAMPANPTHAGLTSQGWNWSLSDAKTHVSKYGRLEVGQSYVTANGNTKIRIRLTEGRTSPYLSMAVNGTIDVDWGDGSAHETVTGSNINSSINTLHTYASAGTYTIIISVIDGQASLYYVLLGYATSVAHDGISYAYSNSVLSVNIGNGMGIRNETFMNMGSLEYITIPKGITSIPNDLFYSSIIRHVVIPDGVTSIGDGAFSYCRCLTCVSIPNSVTSIGEGAFANGTAIKHVTLPDGITELARTFIQYSESLYEFYIPETVTQLGEYAINTALCLTLLTIPAGVTLLGNYSIGNLSSLKELHLKPTNPPTSSNNTFRYLPTDCTIYVPTGCLSAYTSASNYPSGSQYTYLEE